MSWKWDTVTRKTLRNATGAGLPWNSNFGKLSFMLLVHGSSASWLDSGWDQQHAKQASSGSAPPVMFGTLGWLSRFAWFTSLPPSLPPSLTHSLSISLFLSFLHFQKNKQILANNAQRISCQTNMLFNTLPDFAGQKNMTERPKHARIHTQTYCNVQQHSNFRISL